MSGSISVKRSHTSYIERLLSQDQSQAARSVSVIPPSMGGIKIQAKIDDYFAKHSARRKFEEMKYPERKFEDGDLPDVMKDLECRLKLIESKDKQQCED